MEDSAVVCRAFPISTPLHGLKSRIYSGARGLLLHENGDLNMCL